MRLGFRSVLVVVFAAACGADKTASPDPVPNVATPTATGLAVVSGNDQTGTISANLGKALTVRATTTGNAPLSGVTVRFAVTSGSATVSPESAVTDASGDAATTVKLASMPGAVGVTATVQGSSLSAVFRATAILPEPDSTAAATVYNPDWTEASHGKVSPNYDVVFPQTKVNTIEITMTTTQWASIRANMVQLYGYDFGARANAGGGFPDDDPDYVALTVKSDGKAWKKVGFRLKGNSTLSTAWGTGNYKLPFRLKLNEWEDAIPAIKNQRFYGFKELSFSPGRSDPSLIREKSAADILRMAGVPAARTAFYRVFIDFGAGLKYCGLYTAVEVIDDTMIKDQYGEDKGNLYKPESALRTFAEADFEKKNNKTSDFADVQSLISALNSPLRTTNAAQWRTGLEAVFNVDMFLRWAAVNTGMVNWDAYGAIAHNYYLYNHSTKHLTWVPRGSQRVDVWKSGHHRSGGRRRHGRRWTQSRVVALDERSHQRVAGAPLSDGRFRLSREIQDAPQELQGQRPRAGQPGRDVRSLHRADLTVRRGRERRAGRLYLHDRPAIQRGTAGPQDAHPESARADHVVRTVTVRAI
jgi:hypothetical protein